MATRLVFFLILLFQICVFDLAGQLMTHQFNSTKDHLAVNIQPVCKKQKPNLGFQVGVNHQYARKNFLYEWGIHSTEQNRFTAISFESKTNHVHTSQLVQFARQNDKSINTEVTVNNESFWSKENGDLDLIINEMKVTRSNDDLSMSLILLSQVEKIRQPFEFISSQLNSNTYRNWLISYEIKKNINPAFRLQGGLEGGTFYSQSRWTSRLKGSFTPSRKMNISLLLEKNQIHQEQKQSGLYSILSSDFELGAGISIGTVTLHNQFAGFTANLLRFQLRKPGYIVKMEYRELRDSAMDRVVADNVFFASRLLLQVTLLPFI